MKACRGVDLQIQVFLTPALVGGDLSASRLSHFTPRERVPGLHWIGRWMGLGASLDDMEK
jgi:hypothetical protein